MRFTYHEGHVNGLRRVGSYAAEATHSRPTDHCGARADHRGRHAPSKRSPSSRVLLHRLPLLRVTGRTSRRGIPGNGSRFVFPTRRRKRWTNAWLPLPGSSPASSRRMSRSSVRCCGSRWVRSRTSCPCARAASSRGSSRRSPYRRVDRRGGVQRLALALRAACGIETRVWLSDVAGLAPAEVSVLQRWMVDALAQQPLETPPT